MKHWIQALVLAVLAGVGVAACGDVTCDGIAAAGVFSVIDPDNGEQLAVLQYEGTLADDYQDVTLSGTMLVNGHGDLEIEPLDSKSSEWRVRFGDIGTAHVTVERTDACEVRAKLEQRWLSDRFKLKPTR